MESAITECKNWHIEGNSNFIISVNVSPTQIGTEDFAKFVKNILSINHLSPQFLELEITENVLVEKNQTLAANLNELINLGVKIAIDDFGKGYSNLAYIKKLKINALKIDREFIMKLDSNSEDNAIVTAIIEMAQRLNISTVAEGVESKVTLELLQRLGCNYAQGFYWSPAINADDFNTLLNKHCLNNKLSVNL